MQVVCAWCQQRMSGEEDAKAISHGICQPCLERVEGEFNECCGGAPLSAYEQAQLEVNDARQEG